MKNDDAAIALLLLLLLTCLTATAQCTSFSVYIRRLDAVGAAASSSVQTRLAALHDANANTLEQATDMEGSTLPLWLVNATSESLLRQEIDLLLHTAVAEDTTPLQTRLDVAPPVATVPSTIQVFIAPVKLVRTSAAASQWGHDRIDQRDRPLDGQYTPDRDGTGATVWVVDTGVEAGHSEFTAGRASNDYSYYSPAYDCHGHGTHVAGTVGGNSYGVAKKARIRGIKVLDCSGAGTTYTVAQGLIYVLNHLQGSDVVNLSLGYSGQDSTIGAILDDLLAAGVTVVAAAGNAAGNACNHFPSAHTGVLSVASSTDTDARSSFSNYGSCVDLFAPGSSIRSAQLGGGSVVMSGTSMASPHVAGAAALVLQTQPSFTGAQVWQVLLERVTTNRMSSVSGSPNRLLFALMGTNPPQSTSSTSSTTTTASSSTSTSSSGGGGSTSDGATRCHYYNALSIAVALVVFCCL